MESEGVNRRRGFRSGWFGLAEAIARELMKSDGMDLKIVYMAPTRVRSSLSIRILQQQRLAFLTLPTLFLHSL